MGKIVNKFKQADKFWKIFTITLLLLLIAAIVVWMILWNALSAYEKTRPTIVMDRLVAELQSGNLQEMIDYSAAADMDEAGKANFTAQLEILLEGRKISFVKAFSKDKDNYPAFTVKAGEEEIAKVTLEMTGIEHGFGFQDFKIKEITEIPFISCSAVITAPAGYSVFADGILISDDAHIVEKDIVPENLKNIPEGYFTKPTLVQYRVENLAQQPEVTVKDPTGAEVPVQSNEEKTEFQAAFGTNGVDTAAYYAIALEKAKHYSQYVTAWVGKATFLQSVLPDSPMMEGLESIQTGFYTDHKKDYFTDEKTGNLQVYADNCFSCDVSYTQWVENIKTDANFKKALPSAFTFYFVKSGGTWYIADLEIKS